MMGTTMGTIRFAIHGDPDRYRTAIGNARTRSKIAKGLAIPVTMESTAEKSQQRLKAEKEDLEQNIKLMNILPSFMIHAPGIQAAYSAAIAATQGQTMISKLVHVGMVM
ncbi:hypothetical protein Tco_1373552 [Tanacetum coccineum]